MDESTNRSIPPLWLSAAPSILKAGVVWLALAGAAAMAAPQSLPARRGLSYRGEFRQKVHLQLTFISFGAELQ